MGILTFQAAAGGALNLNGPNIAGTVNLTLPSADGTSGQPLQTNGSGTLSFANLAIANGGTGTTSFTANQIHYGSFSQSANLTFDGTNLATTGSLNSANTFGFKNRIINGGMVIDQRNAGASQTINTTGVYTVDRMYAFTTGANATGQRVAGSGNNQYNYQITGAASVTSVHFGQKIESFNSYDLAGTTATLSVNLANSLLTTVTWVAYYAGATDNWTGFATVQIATGTFTVNSTLTQYTAQINIPSAATTGIWIDLSVGSQTSGTWTIGKLQLEKGSTATSFDFRSYGTELALCQRYLPILKSASVITGYAISTITTYCSFPFIVTPRVAPTGLLTNVSGAAVYNATGSSIAMTSIGFVAAGLSSVFVNPSVAAGLITGNGTMVYTANDVLFTGCEL